MTRVAFCLAAALAVSPAAVSAATTTLLFDDFAAEVAGKSGAVAISNFSPLTQWNIVDGTVDLFANGGSGLPCGSAGCLDLDGTANDAARIESKTTFSFVAGSTYEVTLAISGKNGNGNESLSYGIVGGPNSSVSMLSGDNAARTASFSFLPGASFSAALFIDHAGGDNFGILLDSVTLTETTTTGVVPLPATLPLVLGGFGLLGALRARRRA